MSDDSGTEDAAGRRADAIEGFAQRLRELRESVGNPSFRELSGRSRAISHTTLHEAAQGHRLPSWPTVVEFVKACGADPEHYRERWDDADQAVRTPARTRDTPPVTTPPDTGTDSDADTEATATDAGTRRRRSPARLALLAGSAVAVAAVAALVLVLTSGSGGGNPAPGHSTAREHRDNLAAASPTHLPAADCPVQQVAPPHQPPTTPGDHGVFVADRTLPDCTHVARDQVITKTWEFRNAGTVTWQGYSLHRIEQPQQGTDCQTISEVPIPTTVPGRPVLVSTRITTPGVATFCFVRFRMYDGDGRVAFPGGKPVNFQVIVDR